jgi:hypothetical protein
MVHTSKVYRAQTSGKPGRIERFVSKVIWTTSFGLICATVAWTQTEARISKEEAVYYAMDDNTQFLEKEYTPREHMLMSLTIYGEASGQCRKVQSTRAKRKCMEAVALVIKTRKEKNYRGADTYEDVIMMDKMFSVWNNPPKSCFKRHKEEYCSQENKKRMAVEMAEGKNPTARLAWNIAYEVMEGHVEDFTNGATHYHAKSVMPKWAQGKRPCLILDQHLFYCNVR